MNLFHRISTSLGLRAASPLELASRELTQAQIDLLVAEAWREHFTSQASMLRGRINRLRSSIIKLSKEASQ